MATRQSTVDLVLEQAGEAGNVTAKKMFGEYALYCDGKLVALICDEQLFLKPTPAARAYLGEVTEAPPYPSAKPCFLIPGEAWDDAGLAVRARADLRGGRCPHPWRGSPRRGLGHKSASRPQPAILRL